MRELDFLPAWYPQTRRRRRLVFLQAYMTIILAAGLGLFVVLSQRNVRGAQSELNMIRDDLAQTASDLQKLDELLLLEKQLSQQQQVFDKLGTYVEVTRMLGTIESVMPREMALVGLKIQTVEQMRPVKGLASAATSKKPEMKLDRKLEVTIKGVAPTHVDVADFVVQLSNLPQFEHVSPSYGRDTTRNSHIMREFQVTFTVNLNTPPPSATPPASFATASTSAGEK